MSFDQPLPPFNAGDPTATFLSSSCLDFLLIELVPMAYRVTNELEDEGASGGGGGDEEGRRDSSGSAGGNNNDNDGTSSEVAAARAARKALDEDEERDAVFYRLETLGYRVGQGLVERYVFFFFFPTKQNNHHPPPLS